MIGGITKGSCFSGCVEYALALKEKNKEARLLYSEGLLTDTPKDIIDGFECQRHLNSRVQHWCGHISLSYSPKDAERMDDDFMVKLALEYMDKMGIKNTQFIIVRHLDSSTKSLCSAKNEHPHCHIVYNRVDNDGKCVSDSFEYYRNNEICDEMKQKNIFGHKATAATAAPPATEPPTDLSVVSDPRLKAALADIEKYLGDNYGTPTARLQYKEYTNGARLTSEDTTFAVSLVILTTANGAVHLPDNVLLLGGITSTNDDDWLTDELGNSSCSSKNSAGHT